VGADAALEADDQPLAAAALDRAYGLDPANTQVAALRTHVLDQLEVREHGLVFRFIPTGTFLMGSTEGDADERPVRPVRVEGFWLSDTPVTWADYCRLMGWAAPPDGAPVSPEGDRFELGADNRIRLQYCESHTRHAVDWHAHAGMEEHFGKPPRDDEEAEPRWDEKPMVAVSWQMGEELGRTLTTAAVEYGLPSEAEWERGARGGLIGKRYSWGDEPPDPQRCDCDHFGTFVIRRPRELPPNGYGLYGMCGGVWEWTRDGYDALAYHPRWAPPKPEQLRQRVLRGGSFSDGPDAVTVSFRMAGRSRDWRQPQDWQHDPSAPMVHDSPNVGFRLARRLKR
jgi:formylglycine-generating enzyme required for sulfatase activity